MPLLIHHQPKPLDQAKEHLRTGGWSYRRAAAACGVSYQYFSDVLNGWRLSRTLEAKIMALPECPANLRSVRATRRMTDLT